VPVQHAQQLLLRDCCPLAVGRDPAEVSAPYCIALPNLFYSASSTSPSSCQPLSTGGFLLTMLLLLLLLLWCDCVLGAA
jgi:hypothetical protein